MKQRTQLKLKQLAVITLTWLMVGLFISIYDRLVLLTNNSLGLSDQYSFSLSLAMNLGSALIGAALGGSFMIFFINVRYQDKPYGYTILSVSVGFIIVILLIITLLGMITIPIRTGKPITDPVSLDAFRIFLLDSSRIKNIMTWSVVVAITQFLLQINSKFGQGALGNIILGKYNTPKEEKKIFMFLDLNSSTSIAERLGDERYHELLKDFFEDITNPILDNKGEIYQYVGDEVIVAWKFEDGIENSQCVRCFYDIKSHVQKHRQKYMDKYGFVPSFKAGIHCGNVVAGEVGIIKRDITYSGDVLNTASRILSLCKEFNAEIISSADLIAGLCLGNSYEAQPLGAIKLRGKAKEMMLSTLTPYPQV
jgi:adenylate cyclase